MAIQFMKENAYRLIDGRGGINISAHTHRRPSSPSTKLSHASSRNKIHSHWLYAASRASILINQNFSGYQNSPSRTQTHLYRLKPRPHKRQTASQPPGQRAPLKNLIAMDPIHRLLDWASSHSIELNGITPKVIPGRGIGLVATRTIKVKRSPAPPFSQSRVR